MFLLIVIIVYGIMFVADIVYTCRYATGDLVLVYREKYVEVRRRGIFRDYLIYTLSRKKYSPTSIDDIIDLLYKYPIIRKGTMIRK